jgi:hypothetical protein
MSGDSDDMLDDHSVSSAGMAFLFEPFLPTAFISAVGAALD